MRFERMEYHRVTHLGTLGQCPRCGTYYTPDNDHAHESARLEQPFTEALAAHCVPCGAEVEEQLRQQQEMTE